jgi:hypothetical protein
VRGVLRLRHATADWHDGLTVAVFLTCIPDWRAAEQGFSCIGQLTVMHWPFFAGSIRQAVFILFTKLNGIAMHNYYQRIPHTPLLNLLKFL